MRILYLNPIGALGGAERSLLDILAAMRALEPAWELHLIAGAEGALLDEARRQGVSVELLPMPEELLVLGDSGSSRLAQLARMGRAGFAARAYARKLRDRVESLNPDLIHSNGVKFHLLTRLMGRVRAPVVWHIRDFLSSRRLMRHALRWSARTAALAVANSEATAADARTVLRGVKVRAMLNGIDTQHFSPGPGDGGMLDKLSGLPPAPAGTLRAGLLASYARWKGQDVFLRAAAQVATRCTARFYVVGGPIYKTQGSQFSLDELRELARGLGLEGHVGFVPFQNEPAAVYRALDVVVHASTQPEPFGRTIAEAMATTRAVIVAQAGGTTELFTPGEDALGVTPGDVSGLANAMARLLEDPALRERLAARARTTALERFSLERMGREMRAIYGEFGSPG